MNVYLIRKMNKENRIQSGLDNTTEGNFKMNTNFVKVIMTITINIVEIVFILLNFIILK